MAHPDHGRELARFESRVQRSKNRLVAIPADVRSSLGLGRRGHNHIIHVSIRRRAAGRWNHHYFKLTADNEFSIPADIAGVQPGDRVEVKVHKVIPDVEAPRIGGAAGAEVLLRLAERSRPGWRRDGSARVDEYLREEARGTIDSR